MEKFREFFAVITAIRSGVRDELGSRMVKTTVKDSLKNNRTPTVNQIIRFTAESKDKRLTKEISAVYVILKPYMSYARTERGSKRTDAYDINELVLVYRDRVMNKKQFRRQIGQILGQI